MFVCVCNAIRDSELRSAARRSCGGAEAVYALMGKRPDCSTCLDDAEMIIDAERANAAIPLAA